MARPKDPEAAVPVMVRMSFEMSQELRALADSEDRSMAAVARDMLRAQLRLPDPETGTLPLDLPGRSSAA